MTSLTNWLNNTQTVSENIAEGLVHRIAATMGEEAPRQGDGLPLLWHWAFFQAELKASQLGEDGHPARGEFLPPADNRNRMWAGGRLQFHSPLIIGIEAERISTIINIEEKQGRSGALLFVTVKHDYRQQDKICLSEEQDIVYKIPSKPKLTSDKEIGTADWQENHQLDSVTLFRYSAVTFNGHRIHYDYPYATGVENYPGLVVHGPLIATLNLRAFCRSNPTKTVKSYSFQSLRPLFQPDVFYVAGNILEANKGSLWAANDQGVAQKGTVEFF